MIQLFPLLLSTVFAAVDYSTEYWYTPSWQLQSSLPSSTYVRIPSGFTVNELEELHQYCVDQINKYRTGDLKFSDGTDDPDVVAGIDPLGYGEEYYSCTNAQAMGDLIVNVQSGGGCAGGHATSDACGMGGYVAFNSCCGRGGGSWGNPATLDTLSEVKNELDSCLQQMWDEGITDTEKKSHWLNMKGTYYTHVSCGFAWTSTGRVMMNQDFTSRTPTCTSPDCTTGTLQWTPNQCSPKSDVPTGCSGPPTTPTTSPPTTPPATSPPTTPPPTSPSEMPTDAEMRGSCATGHFQTCNGMCWRPFSALKEAFEANWNEDRSATCDAGLPEFECCDATYCGIFQPYCLADNPNAPLYKQFSCPRLKCGNPYCDQCDSTPVGFNKGGQTQNLSPYLIDAVNKEDPNENQAHRLSIFLSSVVSMIVSLSLIHF